MKDIKRTIKRTESGGVDVVEITTAIAELDIVASAGPRIASLRLIGGENILLWEPGRYMRGFWDLGGGHRVWVAGMGADESEDTYAEDNRPCEVKITEETVTVIGERNPQNKTRRGLSVRVLTDGLFVVENFVINDGPMLYAGGIWALTCTVPSGDTQYAIPIGNGSDWDAFIMKSFNKWAGHGQGGFSDPQINVTENAVLVNPQGAENKRAVQAHRGIIAMEDRDRGLVFAKMAKYEEEKESLYPDRCNVAFYIGPDNFMVEMETMGPQSVIKPGGKLSHFEFWAIRPGGIELTRPDELEALFCDVP